jgi:transposase
MPQGEHLNGVKHERKQAVKEKPDAYLCELAQQFDCTPQAVFYILLKMKITVKKTFTHSEKSEEKLVLFTAKLNRVPVEKRVFVDESGLTECLKREFGRAPRREPFEDIKSGKRFERINVIAALFLTIHFAVSCYTHTTNREFFENWFANCLLKEIPKGYTVIMDNAGFHCKKRLRKLVWGKVRLLFLPPYSPDCNICKIF